MVVLYISRSFIVIHSIKFSTKRIIHVKSMGNLTSCIGRENHTPMYTYSIGEVVFLEESKPSPFRSPTSTRKYLDPDTCTEDEEGEDTACGICLESILGKSCLMLPRCGHIFHEGCINKWRSQKPECPVCRTVVLRQYVGIDVVPSEKMKTLNIKKRKQLIGQRYAACLW